MKCRSVVGIWPEVPPIHRVTAVAVLRQPPTLYTGAADGSVVWWSISGDDSHKDIKPIAILCGHTCAIAGLGICYPLLDSGNGNTDLKSNKVADTSSSSGAALISSCTDGVLCIWSRGSGHCRRRRKLPPWTGSPSALKTLPGNPRYVCITCCFFEGLHVSDHEYVGTNEGNQSNGDPESSYRKYPKCSVVIVDSYTLTITQTVFHGNLSIGPSRFLSIVAPFDDVMTQSALMVDSLGKLQLIPILKDSHLNIEAANKLNDGSCDAHQSVWGNEMHEGEADLMAMASTGRILGLVYKTRCVFMASTNNAAIGEIPFEDDMLYSEADPGRLHAAGGMFLLDENKNDSDMVDTLSDIGSLNFAAWNTRGLAIVYQISYMNQIFNFKPVYNIPAVCYPTVERLSIDFVQMDDFLLRIESTCFHEEDPLSWKPHITVWSLLQRRDDHENSVCPCKTLGGGDYLNPWIARSIYLEKVQSSESFSYSSIASAKTAQNSYNNGIISKEPNGHLTEDELKYLSAQGGHRVSSSMVIAHNSQTPYAVVYGYYSGEISLLHFDAILPESSSGNDPCHQMEHQRSQLQFLGHKGPVLCLATHRMRKASAENTRNDVLLSGSVDCTVRVWELSTGKPIMVMHQHVSPVRQIILPPRQIDSPWDDCFLSVGDDCCVSLASLDTLQVERMFPGHPYYPARVVWDGARGYLACLSQNRSSASGAKDVLFIWDIKSGSRERVLRGTASHSMFDNFCKGVGVSNIAGSLHGHNTSASSLLVPSIEVGASPDNKKEPLSSIGVNMAEGSIHQQNTNGRSTVKPSPRTDLLHDKLPVRCSSPLSGIAVLTFDLSSLTSTSQENGTENIKMASRNDFRASKSSSHHTSVTDGSDIRGRSAEAAERNSYDKELSLCFLRFSLSFLHLWDVQLDLDKLLVGEMMLRKPKEFILAPGLQGDRGSVTLAFPGLGSTLELWKSSSEFSAMRSLAIVSIAQCIVGLSSSSATASSGLSAFYTRHLAEQYPLLKPPSLQLLVSFWQDEDEHIRLAARTLFHCAAARAIPDPLRCPKTTVNGLAFNLSNPTSPTTFNNTNLEKLPSSCLDAIGSSTAQDDFQYNDSDVLKWLESYEMHDWLSCVGGTSQDAMTSHIIVAAALAIWYPSLVKPSLAMLTVQPLMKLVVAMNDKYSSTAAELLAEGMDSTWKACIASEIPHLIGDIFFQIECVTGASPVSPKLRETLVGVLLPSLALADIHSFLSVVEGLIWSTASDSPVHLVSIKTLIRVVRASPRSLAQYLNKVINFILQTMDPSNSVMRKTCVQSSLTALKEVARVYPMVALNETSTRLAVGDAVADANAASIHVYDLQSVAKIKVLDASGPPGMPSLLPRVSDTITTAISALTFSQDGEGLVAFSENGLIVRWWSLGSGWWEKLSRNFVPIQCTKLIFLPPWEGFSPNASRASIMGSILGNDSQSTSQDHKRDLNDLELLNHLIHNLDLSYRLEWENDRKVNLTKQGHMLGTFQL